LLKKQARILGFSATRARKCKAVVIGVVFRGSYWLDGVISFPLDLTQKHNEANISKGVMKSVQFSQLHAVILSQRFTAVLPQVDLVLLSRGLRLPVLAIVNGRRQSISKDRKRGMESYVFQVTGKEISVLAVGASLDETREIFNVGRKPDFSIPEPARVAELIAEQAF
jgi:endonuclease V-like protein UPF0215 family